MEQKNKESAKLTGSETDREVIELLISGAVSRNKNYDFFMSDRGKTLHRQSKIMQGLFGDIKNGAKIIEKRNDGTSVILVIENEAEKYKRTMVLTETMYEVFTNKA